jgi:hypothetical protein
MAFRDSPEVLDQHPVRRSRTVRSNRNFFPSGETARPQFASPRSNVPVVAGCRVDQVNRRGGAVHTREVIDATGANAKRCGLDALDELTCLSTGRRPDHERRFTARRLVEHATAIGRLEAEGPTRRTISWLRPPVAGTRQMSLFVS